MPRAAKSADVSADSPVRTTRSTANSATGSPTTRIVTTRSTTGTPNRAIGKAGSGTPTGTPTRKPPACSKCHRPRAGHPRTGCPFVDSESVEDTLDDGSSEESSLAAKPETILPLTEGLDSLNLTGSNGNAVATPTRAKRRISKDFNPSSGLEMEDTKAAIRARRRSNQGAGSSSQLPVSQLHFEPQLSTLNSGDSCASLSTTSSELVRTFTRTSQSGSDEDMDDEPKTPNPMRSFPKSSFGGPESEDRKNLNLRVHWQLDALSNTGSFSSVSSQSTSVSSSGSSVHGEGLEGKVKKLKRVIFMPGTLDETWAPSPNSSFSSSSSKSPPASQAGPSMEMMVEGPPAPETSSTVSISSQLSVESSISQSRGASGATAAKARGGTRSRTLSAAEEEQFVQLLAETHSPSSSQEEAETQPETSNPLASLTSAAKAAAYVLPLENIPAIERAALDVGLYSHHVRLQIPPRASLLSPSSGPSATDSVDPDQGVLVVGSDAQSVRVLVASLEADTNSASSSVTSSNGSAASETPKGNGVGLLKAGGYMAVGAAAMFGGLAFS